MLGSCCYAVAGFFLALLGEVLLLMSACCAIASGGDEGRCWFWPTPHPGLPMTMKGSAITLTNGLTYVMSPTTVVINCSPSQR